MLSGEYDICFRGLTLREAWRFSGGPFQFVLALLLKAAAFKSGRVWLPARECEAPCAEADLSPEARQDLLPVVDAARALGYTDGAFARAIRILDPNMLQGFSYLALHRDHQRGLFIGFVLNSAAGTTRRIVALTGALVAADGTNHEFLNHRQHFDSGGLTCKHQLRSRTVAEFDASIQSFMANARGTFRSFDSTAALKAYMQTVEDQTFETRLARGLFRPSAGGTTPNSPSG